MNELSPWTGSDWYALGILLTQFAFLVAGVWFARNLLRIFRAFQEQLGALLKVSITAAPEERSPLNPEVKYSRAASDRYWLLPSEPRTDAVPEPQSAGPNRFATAWHGIVLWLNAPMHTSEVSAWRRVITWLQAPAGG
jgi:hypothetical protein